MSGVPSRARLLIGAFSATFLLAFAPGALAATLSVDGLGNLNYTGGAGANSAVEFDEIAAGTVAVHEANSGQDLGLGPNSFGTFTDNDAITPGAGCTDDANNDMTPDTDTNGDPVFTCTGVTAVVANPGDLTDAIDASGTLSDVGGDGLTTIPLIANLGDGDDAAVGGTADDVIHGNAGDDEIGGDQGGPGGGSNDQLFGDEDNDSIGGGSGADLVDGGIGDDPILVGGPGPDTINGGDGNDGAPMSPAISGGPGPDTINGGAGDDRIDGDCGDEDGCGLGSDGDDTINAGDGDDLVFGRGGNDTINGDAGDDFDLEGGSGNDTVDGGAGDDSVYGDCTSMDCPNGALSGDDVVRGSDGNDDVHGGPGNDNVDGGAGDDNNVGGGPGNDTVNGGDGNDDFVTGGPDDDTVNGGAGDDDEVNGQTGNDNVDGGAGNDDDVGGGPGTDTVNGGDGNDFAVKGGPDNDTVSGGAGDDSVYGDCGGYQNCGNGADGNDTVHGDSGQDFIEADAGTDTMDGGSGIDAVGYEDRYEDCNTGPDCVAVTHAVSVTLDGVANDGGAGENDNVVGTEDVDVFDGCCTNDVPEGGASIVGDSGVNSLSGSNVSDTIDGNTGNDFLFGNGGDDTMNANDGFADRVVCGSGNDTANVDEFDQVADDCEVVNRTTRGKLATEDAQPTVAWTSPAADGAKMSTSTPNTLAVNATDDKGITQVVFLAGKRVLCTDTTAPYTCAYSPDETDVGKRTLQAIAFDTAQQTATALREVTVPRFKPRKLTSSTKPKRDSSAPFKFTTKGRLVLPSGVTPATGCSGKVAVQIKAGKKTISTRRAKVHSNCRYRSKVTFSLPSRLHPSKLRVFTKFRGNKVLTARSAKRHSVRVR